MDANILSLAELKQLRHDEPEKLFSHLQEIARGFLFGVEDHREEPDEWGGEFRVLVNRNVEVHLVPRFNAQMERVDELPQWVVMPDDDRAGTELERTITIDDEGETVPAVVFYVEPEVYERLLDELAEIVGRYDDFDVIPDTYFLETELVALLTARVLEHESVKAERNYDFRRGLVGGDPPPDLVEEESDLDHGEPPTA